MPHLRRTLALAAAALFGLVATAGGAQAHITTVSANAQPAEQQGRLVLVLDSSGSMAEDDATGRPRIEAAREALGTVVDSMPDEAQVGLRVFGATVFSKDDEGACEDSQLVVPVGTADKPALQDAIANYEPYGETPIAYALQQAADDLGGEGPRTILLVSDGEATCDPDPCVVAEQLAAEGIDLKIDVVGFNVDGAAEDQLSCVADKGNGTYYDADNAEDLVNSVDTVASRALQAFEVNGTPIEGTPQYNDAPEMATGGQYIDTIPAAGEQKFYSVPRSTPNSNIVVGISGRPELDGLFGALNIHLQTEDGEDCSNGYGRALNDNSYALVAGSVATLTQYTLEADDPCTTAETLQLVVEQGDGDDIAETPIQFKVWEYGAVENYDDLPAEPEYDEAVWAELTPDFDNATALAGGASFDDAPKLEAGTSITDTIVPGEMRLFKIDATWGQKLQAQVNFDELSDNLADHLEGPNTVGARIYGPSGADATNIFGISSQSTLSTGSSAVVQAATQEIRYRNFESVHDFSIGAAVEGEYYIGVALGANEGDASVEVPFTLTTSLEGEAGAGEPQFAEVKLPTDSADEGGDAGASGDAGDEPDASNDSTEPVASEGDGGSLSPTTMVIGVGGLILLLLGALGVYRWTRSAGRAAH